MDIEFYCDHCGGNVFHKPGEKNCTCPFKPKN